MLNPNQEIYLFRMIASALPDKVQCSNEKSGKYKLNIPKVVAIKKYKFIQFAHPLKYQFLSIDIDNRNKFKTFNNILDFCKENNIPEPTIILKTSKGWHIHWYLDEALWKNNKYHMAWRKEILNYLNGLFGGDKHAAGFIFRNPFKHDIVFKENVYTIDDFCHLVDFDSVKNKVNIKLKFNKNKIKRLKKFVDFTKVQVGERNNTLFSYIRTFAFRNFELGLDNIILEGYRVNMLMSEPLPENEVRATCISAYNFVAKNYNPNYKNENQAEYNRKLAKYKAYKTYAKVLVNIVTLLRKGELSFFKLIRELYSFRKLAKFANVDSKTIKKYLAKLKKDLIKIIKNKYQLTIDLVDFTFKKFLNKLEDMFEQNKYIGVLRC